MLKELFDYNYQMNRKLIVALKKLPLVPDKSQQLLSHIINAHHIWNGRMNGGSVYSVWELHPLDKLETLNRENCKNTLKLIDQLEPGEEVTYTNTKGETYTNSVSDIFYHIINHSTYHRGQIATDCRNHGVEPLVTDYIFFRRNSL